MTLLQRIKKWLAGPELPPDYWTSRTDQELLDMCRGRSSYDSALASHELLGRLRRGQKLNAL